MASYRSTGSTLTGSGEPRHLNGVVVSAEFFRVLGVRPFLGRDFLPGEEKPGTRVVVLSHQLWQTAFGSALDIAGRTITLDGHSYTVAGVMPAGFVFPIRNPLPDLWTTLADDATDENPFTSQRGDDMLDVIARLKPGVSLAQARADVSVIAHNLATQYPDTNKQYPAAVAELELEHLTGDTRGAFRVLFAAVTLVLLIACVNVAGLLLARASRRRADLALRLALGAGRSRIMRLILVESVVHSLCGGVLGILFSAWILDVLLQYVPQNLPRLDQISVDGSVLAFATLISLLTGLLFGVLPAWRLSRLDPLVAIREGSRNVAGERSQHRLHNGLVIGETAIGLVLLVSSGLLIRSFIRVLEVDPGFDPKVVLTGDLTLPDKRYTQPQKVQFYDLLLARVAALPGVRSVSAGWPLPLSGSDIGISFQIEGHPTAPGDAPAESLSVVTADYFRTMRIPILSGRAFTARDDSKAKPVIIINARFARKYFAGEDPIGKHVKSNLGDGVLNSPVREVVAVVGDVKRNGPTKEVEAQYYLPWAQAVITSPTLCIRTAGDPSSVVAGLRGVLADMDKNIPLYRVHTLEDSVYRAAGGPRFHALLLTCFAGMALLLSAVGLYAVLSYMVVQRTSEIGVRMALGAQRTDVLRMIVRRGLTLAVIGAAIGVGVAVPLTNSMADMLYGVEPLDFRTYAAVTAILLLVSLIASSVPAFRAARLDPMKIRDQ